MRRYEIIYTNEAEQDLRNIYEYIAFQLLNLEAAKNQTNRIMDVIKKLDTMFLRFKLYDKEPWYSKALRILTVDNYLVFYQPIHQKRLWLLSVLCMELEILNTNWNNKL